MTIDCFHHNDPTRIDGFENIALLILNGDTEDILKIIEAPAGGWTPEGLQQSVNAFKTSHPLENWLNYRLGDH